MKICPLCKAAYGRDATHCERDGEVLCTLPPGWRAGDVVEASTEERPPRSLDRGARQLRPDPETVKVPTRYEKDLLAVDGTGPSDDRRKPFASDEVITTGSPAAHRSPGDVATSAGPRFEETTEPSRPEWSVRHRPPTDEESAVEDTQPEILDEAGVAFAPLPDDARCAVPTTSGRHEVAGRGEEYVIAPAEPTFSCTEPSDDRIRTVPEVEVGELSVHLHREPAEVDLASELEGPSFSAEDCQPEDCQPEDILAIEPASGVSRSYLVAPTAHLADPPIAIVSGDQRRFGRYVLLYRFASGGMADLFLASFAGPAGFEKLVAIKRIHEHLTAQPGFLEMFLDEARLAARISHSNVVDVIELGRVDESYFIAMEYVAGQTLRTLLRHRRLSYAIAARVVSQAASGLHAAHELRDNTGELLNVVHRDVSPGNILVSYDGMVKVADFGVARARGNLHTTAVGMVKGKFAYMAPEQARAEQIDRRTDIFSLGIVLYEATTRRRLFRAQTEQATLFKVLSEPILPPSALDEDYPLQLEQVVLRALERDPRRRFQTAHELHDALEAYIHDSDERVLPSDIGKLMRATFAEQIRNQREAIQRSQDRIDGPISDWAAGGPASVSSSLDGTVSAAKAEEGARRRFLGVAVCVIAAALLVLVLAYVPHVRTMLGRGDGDRSSDAPATMVALDRAQNPDLSVDAARPDAARPDAARPDSGPPVADASSIAVDGSDQHRRSSRVRHRPRPRTRSDRSDRPTKDARRLFGNPYDQ